jgi:hypothetical protein
MTTTEDIIREANEEDYYEKNKRDFCVHFKGTIWIEALTPSEAIDKAQERDDIYEYIDNWNCNL